MRGLWAFAVCAALVGCVHIDVEERVERGPLLRSFDREVLAQRGVSGEVEVAWPNATVRVSQFEVCRTERVDEYAEDHISERTARSVGPAITLGITGTLVGTGLLAARGLFSADPDTRVIDGGGRYGISSRQRYTGIALGALALGLPALAVGLIGIAQSGQSVNTAKAEQVVDARDQRCHLQPAEGPLALGGEEGPLLPARPLQQGLATFSAEEAQATPGLDRALFDGRPIELLPDDAGKLSAFAQCAFAVGAAQHPEGLAALTLEALRDRLFGARRCEGVPGAPGDEALRPLRDEAARRQSGGAR